MPVAWNTEPTMPVAMVRTVEVDPEFGNIGLIGKRAVPLVNGAYHDEEKEMENRRGAEGEDRLGGPAGTGERDGPGAAL